MKLHKHTYLLCIVLFCTHSFVWATNINNIRLGTKKSYTRIVFDLNEKPNIYNIKYLSSPERIIIDFTKGKIKPNAIKNIKAYPLIKNIKASKTNDKNFSVEIELNRPAKFKHFILTPSNGLGYRLVIDITKGKHSPLESPQIIFPDPQKPISKIKSYKRKSVETYNREFLSDATMDRLFQPLLGNTQLRETHEYNSILENNVVKKQKSNTLIKTEIDNSPKFNIRGYKIKGNTLLSINTLKNSINPYTGKNKTFSDVQHALEALELNYRKSGFGMVQVYLPEQELDKGIIELNIIEPTINTITIQGTENFDVKNIQNSVVSLKKGATPNTKLISKNLTLINENPAKKTSIQFISSEKEGELNTVISVKDKAPTSYSLSLDNTGTDTSGNYRLGFSYQHANLTNNDDVLNFLYTTSEKSNALNAYSFGYHLPLYSISSSLDIFAGNSEVDSGVIQNLYTVTGKGVVFGLRLNQLLNKQGNYTHRLSYGFDYRSYDTDAILLSGGGSIIPDIDVHPLSFTYSGQWTSTGAATGFNVQLHYNAFTSEQDKVEFNASRTNAKPDYFIFRYGVEHAQAFAKTWQMRFALTGQQTSNALISGEQFGVGGATSVRGYNERGVSNDNGTQATAEVYTPSFATSMGLKGDIRGLFFYDTAHVSRNLPQSGDTNSSSISSIGAGIRLNYKDNLTFKLDIASPLKDAVTEKKGDTKIHTALKYVF